MTVASRIYVKEIIALTFQGRGRLFLIFMVVIVVAFQKILYKHDQLDDHTAKHQEYFPRHVHKQFHLPQYSLLRKAFQ